MNTAINQVVRSSFCVLMVVCAVGPLGGCQDTRMAPTSGRRDPISVDGYPVNVALEGLGKYLVFGDSIVRSGVDEPLRIVTAVRPTTDKELSIQYRYQFFDKDRAPLQLGEGWHHKRLPSRVESPLVGAALDTSATYWRLQVRPAR